MEEKIKSLFQSVNLIAMDYLFRQKQNNIKHLTITVIVMKQMNEK